VDHLVINRPKSVEVQHFLIPRSCSFHFTIGLVADAVVHILEAGNRQEFIEDFLHVVLFKAREEGAFVIDSLDKGVDGIAVCFY